MTSKLGAFERMMRELEGDLGDVKARVSRGYEFPEFPSTNGKWDQDFAAFSSDCAKVLKQRLDDKTLLAAHQDIIDMSYSDAVILFNIAIITRDVELIKVYHRFLIAAAKPSLLNKSFKIFRKLPEGKAAQVFDMDHVSTYQRIETAIWESEQCENWDVGAIERLIDDLAVFTYEDISQIDRILTFIRVGTVEPEDIRKLMDSASDIATPLLEGAL